MKRWLLLLVTLLALPACGGGDGKAVAYRPIAFGENNQCYYVSDPVEVQTLMDQGLCQRSWTPTVMPVYWHQMYYPYYSSPAYYNVYVPAATRSVYVREQKTWGAANKGAITAEAKKATYQGSNGKTVTAEKIGVAKYGAGNRFGPTGTKFGGGDRTTRVTTQVTSKPTPATAGTSKPAATPAPKPTPPKVSKPPSSPKPVKSSPPKSSGGSRGYGGGSRGGGYGGGRR